MCHIHSTAEFWHQVVASHPRWAYKIAGPAQKAIYLLDMLYVAFSLDSELRNRICTHGAARGAEGRENTLSLGKS